MRTARSLGLALMLAAVVGGPLAGCGNKGEVKKQFWSRHPQTLAQVEKAMGKPAAAQGLGGGMVRRYYDYQNPYTDLAYRYFVFCNDKVIASGLADTAESDSPALPDIRKPADADFSRTFYVKRPLTVREISRAGASPVKVYPLEGGLESRIYALNNPYSQIQYRFYTAKDGRVVASGLIHDAREASLAAGPACIPLIVSELGRTHYQANPTSAEDVLSKMGKPLLRKRMASGNEWRLYRPGAPAADQVLTYRFFEISPQGQAVASGVADMVQLCD
jgi:hypothetical protein